MESQRKKINEDEDLASTAVLSTAVGEDGKDREMLCLPEEFVYGWLFTINPKNVAISARDSVRKYRRQCYSILYRHFHGRAQRQLETIAIERSLVEQKDQKIADLQSERLNPQPSLFD